MSSYLRLGNEFVILKDKYYYLTALLLAQNAIIRQYRGSFLGIVWMLLHSLLQVVIFALIMPKLMRFPDTENYVVYLVSAFPLWGFIASTLINANLSLITQAETLKRCIVSTTIFPVADVLKMFYGFLISFTCMYLFCIAFLIDFSWMALLIPLYLIPILLILICAAVALSLLAPYLRDLTELTAVAMNVFFWLTPVIYPISVMPEKYQFLYEFNPFYIMIRPISLLAHAQRLPTLGETLPLLVLTALVGIASYGIYRACRRNFVYYL